MTRISKSIEEEKTILDNISKEDQERLDAQNSSIWYN